MKGSFLFSLSLLKTLFPGLGWLVCSPRERTPTSLAVIGLPFRRRRGNSHGLLSSLSLSQRTPGACSRKRSKELDGGGGGGGIHWRRIDIQAYKALSSDTNKENKKRFATIIELGTPHRPHVMITASDSHYTTRVQPYVRNRSGPSAIHSLNTPHSNKCDTVYVLIENITTCRKRTHTLGSKRIGVFYVTHIRHADAPQLCHIYYYNAHTCAFKVSSNVGGGEMEGGKAVST